jgi:hypothetical protein
MSRVLRLRNYGVYVGDERGAQHHGAHCHVKDRGRPIASLHLVTLEPFFQIEPLPDELMELIRENLDDLIAEWERLNS